MKLTQKQCVLISLLYADIFDYPLTEQELITWLVFQKSEHKLFLSFWLQRYKKFVFLFGRKAIVGKRQERKQWAGEKWELAKKASRFFRYIPTIELIGVTGGLAMENAKKEDDIDIFFIVSPGTIWVSRLLAVLATEILGMRRRPKAQNVNNAICLNMFMTSDAVSLPIGERDFYTAHEVLQMRPVWERDGVYQKFLQENGWVKNFLPTAWGKKCQMANAKWPIKGHQKKSFSIYHLAFIIFEPFARMIQLWYMSGRTNEVVSDTLLRFHPKDARGWVKVALAKRLARYNLPLDNIFYAR